MTRGTSIKWKGKIKIKRNGRKGNTGASERDYAQPHPAGPVTFITNFKGSSASSCPIHQHAVWLYVWPLARAPDLEPACWREKEDRLWRKAQGRPVWLRAGGVGLFLGYGDPGACTPLSGIPRRGGLGSPASSVKTLVERGAQSISTLTKIQGFLNPLWSVTVNERRRRRRRRRKKRKENVGGDRQKERKWKRVF